MFTGLVEEIGTVVSVQAKSRSAVLTVKADKVLEGARLGDSISTNGVCLTISSMGAGVFGVDVMPETMGRSNLGKLKAGGRVNLERAMRLGDRFGGHMVSGHIDGTGVITGITEEENAFRIRIQADKSLLRYIIDKGSIAIDGTSLTVAGLGESWFEVSIIPHTRENTTLLSKRAGEEVNLECDMVGKYIERLMSVREEAPAKVDMDFLRENGFV